MGTQLLFYKNNNDISQISIGLYVTFVPTEVYSQLASSPIFLHSLELPIFSEPRGHFAYPCVHRELGLF